MNIGIVGLGLIGGSIAKALRSSNHNIYAHDLDSKVIDIAVRCSDVAGRISGLNDNITANDSNNVEKIAQQGGNIHNIDVLVFALYTRGTIDIMSKFTPLLKSGAIVTDVGGIKTDVIAEMTRLARLYPHIEFVGGHPMAGRECSGYSSARADIFFGSKYLLTAIEGTSTRACLVITELARELGCVKVICTNAADHDRAIAFSSQLPHVLSNAYVQSDARQFCPDFAGGSFRDFIRVAGLNAEMWASLMIDNKDNIAGEIDSIIERLEHYKKAITASDEDELKRLFECGNRCKAEIKD